MWRWRVLALLIAGATASNATQAANFDKLLSLPDSERTRILRAAIESAGFNCPAVSRTMFIGSDKEQSGHFSVACSNGQEWMVRIGDGPNGRTSTMSCDIVSALKLTCWKKL